MITVRLANADDQHRWDAFVQQHPQALIGHAYLWHDFIREQQRIRPLYWLAEQDGQVCGIAPCFVRWHIGLGKRLTSMPYLNTGGILASHEDGQAVLWGTMREWAKSNGVDAIELRNRYAHLPDFATRDGRSVSIIPLPETHEAAWSNMRSTARNRIRKAEKHGLVAEHGFQNVDLFWDAYAANMKLLGAPVLKRRWFHALEAQGNAHLICVRHDGHIIAGMVLLTFKDGTENTWTGSTPAARDLYTNDFLYWEAARWAIDQGYRWLDLGRSQAGGGHERFKEKFGAETQLLPYQELHRTADGWDATTEEPTALYDAFSAVWQRLPLGISKRIGSYFSRQIY